MIQLIKLSLTALTIIYATIVLSAVIGSVPAQAAYGSPAKCSKGFLGAPHWYEYVPLDSSCNINNDSPVIKNNEGRLVILILMGVFDIVLYIAGFAAVLMVMYGGFKYLTSTGDPQKITSAKTTILNALVGLGIAILASRLVAFFAARFF